MASSTLSTGPTSRLTGSRSRQSTPKSTTNCCPPGAPTRSRANPDARLSISTAYPALRTSRATRSTARPNAAGSGSAVNRSTSSVGRSMIPCSRMAPDPASTKPASLTPTSAIRVTSRCASLPRLTRTPGAIRGSVPPTVPGHAEEAAAHPRPRSAGPG